MRRFVLPFCLLLGGFLSFALAAIAAPSIPAPADTPYPGMLTLAVDATDLQHRVYRVHEEIPVAPGLLTLLYPRWIPGNHSPTGPIQALAGLTITADGRRIEWQRDPVDMYAFHVEVPAGASRLALDFQFVSPTDSRQGRIVATPEIVGLQWNTVVLYPAGHYSRQITLAPSVKLPTGWKFGCALEIAVQTGDSTKFKPVTLNTLVDSPLFAGKYFRRFDLDPGAKVPVHLDVVADAPQYLDAKPEILAAHKALVRQAYKLYGSQHYAHYDFLLSLSDRFSDIGLEHHQSSEDGTFREYLTDPKRSVDRDLLSHEYTHSWNGKFRRPADLWTPNFNVPMRNSLLWVYEGQTQYWGYVLAARSGLMKPEDVRAAIALVAATYDHRAGRVWRDLQDTTNAPIIDYRRPLSWPSWERSEDYYSEGQLVWLDADTKIRELSHGRRSLDDFARAFFGVDNGRIETLTYTFDGVVSALNAVQPYEWARFLHERLDSHDPGAPLDGLARGGWKLAYADKPSAFGEQVERQRKFADFAWSLGLRISGEDGRIAEVLWNSPAFKAELATDMTLVAVNGIAYDADALKQAIIDAKGNKQPIELLVKNLDHYRTLRVDYHDGPRYAVLQRVPGTPDRLSEILAPRR